MTPTRKTSNTALGNDKGLRQDLGARKAALEEQGWTFTNAPDDLGDVWTAEHEATKAKLGPVNKLSTLLDKLDGGKIQEPPAALPAQSAQAKTNGGMTPIADVVGDQKSKFTIVDGEDRGAKTDDGKPKDMRHYEALGWKFGQKGSTVSAEKNFGTETVTLGPARYLVELFVEIEKIEADAKAPPVNEPPRTTHAERKSGKTTPRQPRLPGAEDEKIEEIEEHILRTLDARIEMQETNKIYCDERDALLDVMEKHDVTSYKRAGLSAQVTIKKKNVKVKGPKKSDSDGEDIDVNENA